MSKIGIVAGSFDPITLGHVWLIRKAAELLGKDGSLHIVVGVNPSKKYYFSSEGRLNQIWKVLGDTLPSSLFQSIVVESIDNELLINHARNIGASYIFRGIRNTEDFNYESQIQQVNRKINPSVETVFFIPPSNMSEVSSSTVKGLVGFNGWEQAIEQYVDPIIIEAFKVKLEEKKNEINKI